MIYLFQIDNIVTEPVHLSESSTNGSILDHLEDAHSLITYEWKALVEYLSVAFFLFGFLINLLEAGGSSALKFILKRFPYSLLFF